MKNSDIFPEVSRDWDYNFDYSFEDSNKTIVDHGWEIAGVVSGILVLNLVPVVLGILLHPLPPPAIYFCLLH